MMRLAVSAILMRIQMEISRRTPQIILNFLFLFILINLSYQNLHNDTIFQGEEIRDWQQLRSQNNLFTLQFFSPTETNKEHRYLAIFYNIQPGNLPIWIANRDTPISDASGSLKIDNNGTLKISYGAGNSIILGSSQTSRNSSATLLDNGNLVFSILNFDRSVNQTIWQSYDHGTDTLVPGMRLGINSRTGQNWNLTTSISDQIPGSVSGSFSLGLDPNGTAAQLMIWYKGKVLWRSGIWTNGTFSCSNHESLHFRYISNQEEKYFEYVLNENPSLMRYKFEIFSWITKRGLQVKPSGWDFSKDGCDYYENNMMLLPKCGKHVFSFESRLGYVFGKSVTFEDIKISLFDCQVICVQNCSCLAYASISENGTGCEIWYKGMKFQTTSDTRAPSREVFIRSDTIKGYSSTKWWPWMVLGVILLVSLCTLYFVVRKLRARVFQRSKNILLDVLGSKSRNGQLHTNMSQDVHLFSFDSIVTATDNFLTTNKLGEGGFGSVFKGNLLDGQEVAIKRLSRYSTQGLVEFKNEIQLIAKLQHNNLVRLLGCCIQEDEKILVYEYMTNKSLDFLLFSEDPNKKAILKWSVRINIIEGIAQGLLYLHKYSRLRVIHRDLKASNILLDGKMNPKISDFGLARIFGIQQSEANTKRIVGTYGYMSPEYAMKGVVSMKSDVFSFGVLLLEIISGKKNNSCSNSDYPFNLVGHAWEMWKEGRDLELMDPTLDDDDSMNGNEVKRCIHIGLLCVQDHAMDRPFMSAVVSMLTNETTSLPVPKEPAFFIGESERILEICSTIDRSISVVEPR